MTVYCPVDDKPFPDMEALRAHIKRGEIAGDANHIDIADLEGWDETSLGTPVKLAKDLEPT